MTQTYIDKIKEVDRKDPTFTKKYGGVLLKNFLNELHYIEYKSNENVNFEVIQEIKKVKALYLFNASMRHWYLGMNNIVEQMLALYRNGLKLPIERIYPCMSFEDYAFYDGTPVKEVIEELNQVKDK